MLKSMEYTNDEFKNYTDGATIRIICVNINGFPTLSRAFCIEKNVESEHNSSDVHFLSLS